MKSIWGDGRKGDANGFSERMQALVDNGMKDGSFRASLLPQDIPLARIFSFLRGKNNLIKKREIAKDVLLGECGLKNKIHAKLLLGPKEFEEVVNGSEDIVPHLIELLGEKTLNVKANAVRALGERGDARALPAMCLGLKEEKYWVRYEFADALRKISTNLGDEQDVRELCKVLAKHVRKNDEFSGHLRLARKALDSFASRRDSWNEFRRAPLAKPVRIEETGPGRPNTTLRMQLMKK